MTQGLTNISVFKIYSNTWTKEYYFNFLLFFSSNCIWVFVQLVPILVHNFSKIQTTFFYLYSPKNWGLCLDITILSFCPPKRTLLQGWANNPSMMRMRMEQTGIDCYRLEYAGIDQNRLEQAGICWDRLESEFLIATIIQSHD